jgi:hypothetical protein
MLRIADPSQMSCRLALPFDGQTVRSLVVVGSLSKSGETNMLNYQKAYLEDLFLDGVSLDEALHEIGIHNCEQDWDAKFTWSRWMRELDTQGFYSY